MEHKKSTLDPKTVRYSPRNWPETTKTTSFCDVSKAVHRVHAASKIDPRPQNNALSPTKLARKDKLTFFLRHLNSHVRVHGVSKIDSIKNGPKQRVIAHENGPKKNKNNEFSRHLDSLHNGSSSIKNQPDTPKQCVNAHETSPKRQKHRIFVTS